jgi:hypothetical protein
MWMSREDLGLGKSGTVVVSARCAFQGVKSSSSEASLMGFPADVLRTSGGFFLKNGRLLGAGAGMFLRGGKIRWPDGPGQSIIAGPMY